MVFAPAFGDPSDVYVDGYLTGGTDFGLDVMHPLFQAFLDEVAERRFEMLERVTGSSGSILDVGCGSGEVLQCAARRGWSAIGVEPVAESVAIAQERGLDVRCAMLEESGIPERSFDVVSAFHVLEHMPDGRAFLKMLGRWAKPGGYVLVEVPNWRSFHRRNNGSSWPCLRPLEHIGHYTPATLGATLRRAGLEPVRVRTTTYMSKGAPVQFAVAELGQQRLQQPLRRLSKKRPFKDGVELFPGRLAWTALTAVAGAYDVAKVGHVVLGIARVP